MAGIEVPYMSKPLQDLKIQSEIWDNPTYVWHSCITQDAVAMHMVRRKQDTFCCYNILFNHFKTKIKLELYTI